MSQIPSQYHCSGALTLDYFHRKLLDDSDPTWQDPVTVILPKATSHDTILLLFRKAVASIEICTYHTGSQTITEQLSTSVFRNDLNTLRIQIPEWLASSLDQRNGRQTNFNLAVFLLFSFYHGVLHRCLDVLQYSGFSAPDLGSSVCFGLARSPNSLNGVTVTPNFRYIQELARQIPDDVGNVVDWHNAMRTFFHAGSCGEKKELTPPIPARMRGNEQRQCHPNMVKMTSMIAGKVAVFPINAEIVNYRSVHAKATRTGWPFVKPISRIWLA
ncbi:hypothetical protein EV421DRAFT_1739776 [Armillaria borealis]|uniref:Uncharacterized protein n=1 Tax=Armillaria borealis TaxID=47425 RepID=A0AA39J4Q8_9AGAR|nr:hypothetical protein EV421DRAFT_1739776 [Armillaria borealis]